MTATNLYGTRPDIFGNASRLPLADASVDTVLLLDVLEHLAEPEAALSEASRVLRQDGKLLLTIPFAYPMHDQPHDYQRFTEHGLIHRLKRIGLQSIVITETGNAAEAAASNYCMAVAQGGIDALTARSWRSLWVPVIPLLVIAANLLGYLGAWLLPTRNLMPGAYYVEAKRRPPL